MKTPAEIKTTLQFCHTGGFVCSECPYADGSFCEDAILHDALGYIEELEERIAIMTEGSGEQDAKAD